MEEIQVVEAAVSTERLEEDATAIIVQVRTEWSPEDVRIKKFTDGITNVLLGLFHKDNPNDMSLMRVYGRNTELLIDREAEKLNFRILHKEGLAPRLLGEFENGLIYQYVKGVTTNVDSIREPNVYSLVAKKMAELHKVHSNMKQPKVWSLGKQILYLIPNEFSTPQKQERFNTLFPLGLAQLQADWRFLEETLAKTKSPVVFCHNDLLLGNIIYDEEEAKVTFIDYEYAGVNHQAFDIANHFDEFAGVSPIDHSRYPGPEIQLSWLRTYLQEFTGMTPTAQQLNTLHWQVQQFSPVAHCLWTLWGLMQAENSELDFDFFQFAASAYEGFVLKRDKYLGTAVPS